MIMQIFSDDLEYEPIHLLIFKTTSEYIYDLGFPWPTKIPAIMSKKLNDAFQGSPGGAAV